jgi:hypothetical protein
MDIATDLPPNPNTPITWAQDDPSHPGFLVHGLDDTPGPKAYVSAPFPKDLFILEETLPVLATAPNVTDVVDHSISTSSPNPVKKISSPSFFKTHTTA